MRRPPGRLPLPHLRRPSRRAVAGALLVAVALIPGWFWLRDSSLVRVSDVQITGLSGPQAAQVREALTAAAERMSTLNLDEAKLAEAVRQFPIVAAVKAHPRPLHELDVEVIQHVPVGALVNGQNRMAVAEDGTILAGTLTRGLPLVPVAAPPGGRTLAEPEALRMVALLGAAPSALRARIDSVDVDEHGLVAQISDGPQLYFGAGARLRAKWAAATRVLADLSSRGAAYLDVRVPERPAAGGLEATDPAGTLTQAQPGVETSQ
jgi:cell division protein FtsQ